jgi:hypothetical protein
MSDNERPDIEAAVDLFVRGAKTLSAGSYLDNNELCLKGLSIIRDAVETLDAANGRDPLLRLLDDPNDFVRTVAAAGLWQSHTARARGVIEHVDRYSITEASMLAMKILMFHGRYNPVGSDPRYASLYEDENGVDCWQDLALRVRALRGELPETFARKPDFPPPRRDQS